MANSKQNNKKLGARIKQLRIQKGMSQKAFAEFVKIHPVQYNRYEHGENVPSTETLGRLADAFDVSVTYLYEGEQEDAVIADFKDQELLRMFKEVESFTGEEKEHVKFLINSVIKNRKMHQLANAS